MKHVYIVAFLLIISISISGCLSEKPEEAETLEADNSNEIDSQRNVDAEESFASAPPEVVDCLRRELDTNRFNILYNNKGSPTQEEIGLIENCSKLSFVKGEPEERSGQEQATGETTAVNFDWSGGKCKGESGTVKLVSPMKPEDIGFIYPYGTIDSGSGHVTPIDHQYLYPVNFRTSIPDVYDVYAPADGYIISVGKRNQFVSEEGGENPVPDYRIVMEHTCTFWTYFDLLTSLTPDIEQQIGELSDDQVYVDVQTRIPIKVGQVVGKVGGRSLDFGAYDSQTTLPGFIVLSHYDGEPWKPHTVDPFDFFTEPARSQLLEKNTRTAEPVGGKIDYDIDGKLVGNWFIVGSGGFSTEYKEKSWRDHLAIFPDAFDPSLYIFSHGDVDGVAQSFALRGTKPTEVGLELGEVKYELLEYDYFDSEGNSWSRDNPAKNLTARFGYTKGTALVKLLENRKLKVEVFLGKTSFQVSGFTEKAKIYER